MRRLRALALDGPGLRWKTGAISVRATESCQLTRGAVEMNQAMQHGRASTLRFERIAFLSSGAVEADQALAGLSERYGNVDARHADVIVALGGDGLMLQTLHKSLNEPELRGKPIYGMNCGSVGFLMNEFQESGLAARLQAAEASTIHPLIMRARGLDGLVRTERSINEVYLFRQTYQAAKLRISVDGRERMAELIADGVLIATPAGSTAYNLSANGPILPLNATLMALTPISAFRPRRWRGALLPDTAKVRFEVLEPEKRPVSAVADHFEIRDVSDVEVEMDHDSGVVILHDPGHSLEERILREQFGY